MLVRMADTPTVKFGSGNTIRNGFMGFVIKLANLLVKSKDTFKDLAVESSTFYSPEWTSFVDQELVSSNERNSRSLGGKPTSAQEEEDDHTQHFDVNMDNIMKRFKCFPTIMQNNSSADDDDETKDNEDDDAEVAALDEPDGEDEKENSRTTTVSSEDQA